LRPASAPVLILVSGPNGAGKSTFAKALGIPVVDPDVEAARERSDIAGGRAAIRRIRTAIGNKESFALETTLSGQTGLSAMRHAKVAGYRVLLFYVGIATPEDALRRIERRVRLGGHDVNSADVRRRYWRSLRNVAGAVQMADEAVLFDNSNDGEAQFVARYERGLLVESGNIRPDWVGTALGP